MNSRIGLVGAAVAGASLVIGVGFAGAAPTKAHPKTAKASALACKTSMATLAPPGSDTVDPAASDGHQYGRSTCGKGFGAGVIENAFTVADSGDSLGKYTQYFSGGSISGSIDLSPVAGDAQPGDGISETSFGQQSWSGTISVTSGTGAYKGAKSAKSGKISCTSADSVHLDCTASLKVTLAR